MKSAPYYSTLVLLVILFTSCQQPTFVVGDAQITTNPTFLFPTSNGEFRTIAIDFLPDDTVYTIEKFSSISDFTGFFGGADRSYIGTFDWTKNISGDTIPKFVASLKRTNRINPTYNRTFERQFVWVNEFQRVQMLRFFSPLNERFEDLRHWNYPYQGERAVKWINNTQFLVLYIASYEPDTTRTPPENLPGSGRETYLLKFDLEGVRPELGEVVTTFAIDNNRANGLEPKVLHNSRYGAIEVSANGEFYAVWQPRFNELNHTPYIMRPNGSLVFNPLSQDLKWNNRYFGQSMFAMHAHPTLDSLFLIGDVNFKQVKLVQIPSSPNQRFTEVLSKNVEELIPNSRAVPWSSFQNDRRWFMQYNNQGTKVAVSHNLPGVDPAISIWDTTADSVTTYQVNQPGFTIRYITMGQAAFAFDSENQNLVYFLAGDTVGVDRADLFVIDSSKRSRYARRVDLSNAKYIGIPPEQLDYPGDMIGR